MSLPSKDRRIDMGLRDILGQNSRDIFEQELKQVKENCLYRLRDEFLCRYIFFCMPHTEKIALLGPYLSEEVTDAFLLETAEKCGASPIAAAALRRYYASLPVLKEDSPVFVMLHVFAEDIWGGEGSYRIEELNPAYAPIIPIKDPVAESSSAESKWLIENIEQRYYYENQLIHAVETGQTHKLHQLMQSFNGMSFEVRASDPLRNMKNYCIIMNTLLRKAAEKGGVHPYHIDRLSSDFAIRIEASATAKDIPALMEDMFLSYCRCVRNYSAEKYSPPVRKALLYISASLNGELSLKKLAQEININPSYLSDLFKKETGSTITEHINETRMKRAAQMLVETTLQVQTVAQYCGIQDVNYFSKVFKKYTGKTPMQYRKEAKG